MYNKVGIVDYGAGNIKSLVNTLGHLNIKVVLVKNKSDFNEIAYLVLPGVGAFGFCMEKLKKTQLIPEILNWINKKKPTLGICVGMQVLAEFGYENGFFNGLGWIKGEVKKHDSIGLTLPHIGWNNCEISKDDKIFNGLQDIRDFYFLHSYVFFLKEQNYVLAETTYGSDERRGSHYRKLI